MRPFPWPPAAGRMEAGGDPLPAFFVPIRTNAAAPRRLNLAAAGVFRGRALPGLTTA